MSRQANVGKEEIERAKQMRDQSMSINQYRKALSVILIGKIVLHSINTMSIMLPVVFLYKSMQKGEPCFQCSAGYSA